MSVLLSPHTVRRRHGAAMKKKRLSFSFSLAFFSQHFPQLFLYSTNLCILVVSHSFCDIKVKRGFGLLSEYQMLVSLKCTINKKQSFMNFAARSLCFIAIKTNPWQVEENMQRFIAHTLYHLASCLKVKVKCSLNLVLLVDNNITAALLFVAAAAAERVYGPWSPLRGRKNKSVLNEKKKTLEHSLVN